MNRDEVIELAHRKCTTYAHLERVRYGFTEAEMMRFAEAVAAHESEVCAKICDKWSRSLSSIPAREIRARATTPKGLI